MYYTTFATRIQLSYFFGGQGMIEKEIERVDLFGYQDASLHRCKRPRTYVTNSYAELKKRSSATSQCQNVKLTMCPAMSTRQRGKVVDVWG